MKISIITPNYNYGHYVDKTIISVVNQDYKDIEHVIVDDGSTDNSLKVIKNLQRQFPKIIRLKNQKNSGQSNALNNALDIVSGDVIGWINSDDTFCDNIFKKIMDLFINNSDIDIVIGDMNVVDIDGKFKYTRKHLKYNFTESCILGFYTTTSSNAVFWRSEPFDRRTYFKKKLNYNMDGEFFSRLFFKKNVYQIFEPFGNFRGDHSTIASNKFDNWDDIVKNELEYERANSFKNTWISSTLKIKRNYFIFKIFQLYRIMRRFILQHYFRKYFELINYKYF